VEERIALSKLALHTGLESGDLTYAAYGASMSTHTQFFMGMPLDQFIKEQNQVIEIASKCYHTFTIAWARSTTIWAQRLIKGGVDAKVEDFDDQEFLQTWNLVSNIPYNYCIRKLQACFIFGQYDRALAILPEIEPNAIEALAQLSTSEFHISFALSYLAAHQNLPPEQQQHYQTKFKEACELIEKSAASAPDNFWYQKRLIDAETARLDGNMPEAVQGYRDAINHTRKRGFLHYEAIACELAGKYWLSQGDEDIAGFYIEKARKLFIRWGAHAKVADMTSYYSRLLETRESSLKAGALPEMNQIPLDLNTAIKASQAMAGEIVLDRLLIQMMKIVIENAGAQKGFLILEQEGEWVIEAEADIDGDTVQVLKSVDVQGSDAVSSGIINYAAHTGEQIVLNDAANEGDFTGDPVVKKRRSKSILCIPLINQGRISGLLYLENNLAAGAFIPERVELLNLLSSQMAMALNNARLYANLEERVAERTIELEREVKVRQQAEEKLRNFLEKLPVAMCMVDEHGEIYFRNDHFVDLFGYRYEDVSNMESWWPRAYPDEANRKWAIETWSDAMERSAAIGGRIQRIEYTITCSDGQERDIEIGGIVLGTNSLVIMIDNTERNRAKQQIEKTKEAAEAANQAKSEFLANMSHELRTPLNAILGFSRMMARDKIATVDQKENLAIINRSGEHLLDMINDVLDLSKIEAGRVELDVETFDLPLLLEDLGRMIEVRAQEAGLLFESHIDEELPQYVKADAGKLRQILINLLGNAVKYTDEGGITLRARSMPLPNAPAMARLQLEVADSGQGIAPEIQERIFEPFYQIGQIQAISGTGLGLAISKSFVKMMTGEIRVDSTPGRGALFRVELPVVLADSVEVLVVGATGPAVLGLATGQATRRILVVEDNSANRLLLYSLLREAGFEVREAENGEEAIDLFEQWQPHLIWIDMRMPVLDGYAATRRIRDLPGGEAVKIVAITASAFKEQCQNILAAGCDEIVYKPFRDHEIFETMARLLDVKYLYDEKGEEATRKEGVELTAEMLAELPPELLQELREAALTLDRQAIIAVIEGIEPVSLDTAKGLRTLADNFQLGLICDLLGDNYEE
jgi:PAS domain S-box-containing protein